MGLLDSVIGAVASQMGGQQQPQAQSGLMNVVMSMLANSGGQGQGAGAGALGGLGGLAGLVSMFQQKGAGDMMSSWIGTGQNMPISGDQLSNILGSEQIGQIASQLGMSRGEASGALADLLPQVIDRLTPQGQLPQSGDLSNQLGDILSSFMKR
jgi:uncharacterized protein YidB (DUF937 family)